MTTMTKVDIRIKGKTYGVRLPVHIWEAFEAHAKSLDWSIAQLADAARKESNGTLTEAIEAYVARWLTAYKHTTRETWLMALVDLMRPEFAKRGYPLPAKIRASIAFTSKGWRGKARGECWKPEASADGAVEIMVCLRERDPVRILNILTHELCHAAQGVLAVERGKPKLAGGHGRIWTEVSKAMDIDVGKGTHALGDPDGAWGAWAKPLLEPAGPMPHSALAEFVAKEKKQTTRMLKFTHEGCGSTEDGGEYVWRASAKSVADKPSVWCPCCGERVPNPHYEGADEDGEDGEEMLLPKGHPLREAEEASVKRGKKFAAHPRLGRKSAVQEMLDTAMRPSCRKCGKADGKPMLGDRYGKSIHHNCYAREQNEDGERG